MTLNDEARSSAPTTVARQKTAPKRRTARAPPFQDARASAGIDTNRRSHARIRPNWAHTVVARAKYWMDGKRPDRAISSHVEHVRLFAARSADAEPDSCDRAGRKAFVAAVAEQARRLLARVRVDRRRRARAAAIAGPPAQTGGFTLAMCGRYELNATPLELSNHFGDLLANTQPLAGLPTSYNIASQHGAARHPRTARQTAPMSSTS